MARDKSSLQPLSAKQTLKLNTASIDLPLYWNDVASLLWHACEWTLLFVFNALVQRMEPIWSFTNPFMFDWQLNTAIQFIILFSLLPLLTYFLKEIKLPRRNLLVEFTCDSCGERTRRLINRVAYEKGTIFLQVCTISMLIHLAREKGIHIFLLQGYECFLTAAISVGIFNISL